MSLLTHSATWLAAIAGSTLLSSNALGAIVTWEYQGIVTSVDNSEGWLTDLAKSGLSQLPVPGSTWVARVTYDTGAGDY